MTKSTADLFTSVSRALLTREAARGYEQARPTENIIGRLRDLGANQIESIIALRDGTGLSWDAARREVYFAPAWLDERRTYSYLWYLREEDFGPPEAIIWDDP